jgi:chemotaxis protein methyltransferase CheR
MSIPLTDSFRPMRASEFEEIRQFAHKVFGLDLRYGKETLVSARLGRKVRELRLGSFTEYLDHVKADTTGLALASMIDALTTNHTSFFREPPHFEFLARALKSELAGRSRLRIWSAACATGEEPYSIAMTVLEHARPGVVADILATDISTRALETAARGIYREEALTHIDPLMLKRHTLQGHGGQQGCVRIKPEIRQLVTFRRVNLMHDFSDAGKFPLIFCRNVMIYFDKRTQQEVVNRLAGRIENGGYLFTGHSETLTGLVQPLKYIRPAIYQKPASDKRGQRS